MAYVIIILCVTLFAIIVERVSNPWKEYDEMLKRREEEYKESIKRNDENFVAFINNLKKLRNNLDKLSQL